MIIESLDSQIMVLQNDFTPGWLLENFGMQLIDFLHPWILVGKNRLPLINKAMNENWKTFVSQMIDCQRFHPYKLYNPLFDDRFILDATTVPLPVEISLKDHRLAYVKHLCETLVCQVLTSEEGLQKSVAVSPHQLQVWGYFAVQAYCTEKISHVLSDELYAYATKELFPFLITEVMRNVLKSVQSRDDMLAELVYEIRHSPRTMANSLVRIYHLVNNLKSFILPIFSYLDRFFVKLRHIPCLNEAMTTTFRDAFLHPLLAKYHETADNPQILELNDNKADLMSVFIQVIDNLCPNSFNEMIQVGASSPRMSTHSSVIIMSSQQNDYQFHSGHPLVKISSVLSDLLTTASGKMTHFVIYIPEWRESVSLFAEYYETDPLPEIKKPLMTTQMSDVVQEFYSNWVDSLLMQELYDILLMGNKLGIQPLVELFSAKVASLAKCKGPEQIKETFGMTEDFTEEEIEEVKAENRWLTHG